MHAGEQNNKHTHTMENYRYGRIYQNLAEYLQIIRFNQLERQIQWIIEPCWA